LINKQKLIVYCRSNNWWKCWC